MIPQLNECEAITSEQWAALDNPQWEGQTRVSNNVYYSVWTHNGKNYSTKQFNIPIHMLDALKMKHTNGVTED